MRLWNFFLLAVGISGLAVCVSVVQAASWDAMEKAPASVEVVNMKPVPLVESDRKDGWTRVPEQLRKRGAVVFMPVGPTNGVADLTVREDGYVLIACNYDYQGNSSGKWDNEDWDEKKFRHKG